MKPAALKLDHFDEIWGVDFEFSCPPGERPQLACLVAIEVKSGRRIRVWKDELATMKTPPYSIGPRSLFVAFTATAEFSCHLALGWELPVHVLDLYPEFRVISNGKPTPCGWGLLAAMVWYGLDTITAQEKEDMRALAISIAEGAPYTEKEKQAVLDYCESDVLCLIQLLPRMKADISLPHALLRGRYMKAAARIEYNGTPIDTQLRDRLLKNWDAIQMGIIAEVDQQYGVYEGTHFKEHLFEGYLARNGIPWPRTGSGRLSRDTKTFEKMTDIYPALKPLRILMDTISQMRSFKLAVGMDGRNRCGIRTFWAKTGRNQPRSSEFIFLASKWLRGMIRPEPGFGLAYIDWGQQEIGIAAKLSGDQKMMAAYQSGDPYLEFAKEAGAAPKDATKKTHKAIRNHFKSCLLGVLYGMEEQSLAADTKLPVVRARDLLRMHRQTYPGFWKWLASLLAFAAFRKFLVTVFGWRIHVGAEVRPTSLKNFLMQANGAEMLRLACCYATERGVTICAPVHDAIMIIAPLELLDEHIRIAQEAMSDASAAVLGGFRLNTDVNVTRYPDHYEPDDEDAKRMWDLVWSAIEKIERQTGTASVNRPGCVHSTNQPCPAFSYLGRIYGAVPA